MCRETFSWSSPGPSSGEVVAGEYLSQKYGKHREEDGRHHEAVPRSFRLSARMEAAQNVLGLAAQDVRVVETLREQEVGRVERERQRG